MNKAEHSITETRRRLQKRRTSLSPSYRSVAARKMRYHALPYLQKKGIQPQIIALYYPLNYEISPWFLIQTLLEEYPKAILVFPKIISPKAMKFIQPKNELWIPNSMGIKEPKKGTFWDIKDIDLLLMPLVGFSRDGRRMGMGGGYYDRFLEKSRPSCCMGLAFSCQEEKSLPKREHDKPMDAILTEFELIEPKIL